MKRNQTNLNKETRENSFLIPHSSFLMCFLLSAFCFLPVSTQAQDIPSTLFGDYEGVAHVVNTTFGIDETMPDIIVALEETGGDNDYLLNVPDLGFYGIQIEMDYVIITPFGDGYKLSRTEPITFIIPEITVPPIPPLLPEGGTFTNVPVAITLENTTINDKVLDLNLKVVATITVVIIIPIPIDIPFNISFNGELVTPPLPPVIITDELEGGTVNEEYYAFLDAESDTPVLWSIISGALPTGLELEPTSGEIWGTPTVADLFFFTVQAHNDWGYDTKLLSIEIENEIDTVGINTAELDRIEIYPNPTNGELRIEISDMKYEIDDIEIYDVFGRILKVENCLSKIEKSHIIIDISHFPAGVYFVKIKTEAETFTRKIIKN